ncbi:hypothetical protein IJ670_02115, partial [bacterium]|nr:hypothetical protein [bacterium]
DASYDLKADLHSVVGGVVVQGPDAYSLGHDLLLFHFQFVLQEIGHGVHGFLDGAVHLVFVLKMIENNRANFVAKNPPLPQSRSVINAQKAKHNAKDASLFGNLKNAGQKVLTGFKNLPTLGKVGIVAGLAALVGGAIFGGVQINNKNNEQKTGYNTAA